MSKTLFQIAFAFTMAGLIPMLASTADDTVTPQQLAEEWSFYGLGSVAVQNNMFYMEEAPGSQGVMVVSPQAYSGDLTLRYEIMPMNAASVCVAILFASDKGADGASLSIPDAYDGSMGHWIQNVDNYFFAFHNQAHNRTPFAVRFGIGLNLGEAPANVMRAGEFHTVEIVRRGEFLRLAINGQLLFEGRDPEPLKAGHIALRIRGIPQIPAACLIRNLTIH
jgi:hypothetical protein